MRTEMPSSLEIAQSAILQPIEEIAAAAGLEPHEVAMLFVTSDLKVALLSIHLGLKEAIAFTPTLIVLTNATVVGDRLYVRLLVADKDGERTFDELNTPPDQHENVDLKI